MNYLSVRYSKILIIAHSMGTLFAIQEACKGNRKIKALFLINTPLIPMLRPVCVGNSLEIVWNCIPMDDVVCHAQKKSFGIQPDKRLWLYLGWIPRYIELFKEIEYTRRCIPRLKVPCRVFLSQKDELVSLRSYNFLKGNPNVKVSVLNTATHFYFAEEHNARMRRALTSLCRKIDSLPARK